MGHFKPRFSLRRAGPKSTPRHVPNSESAIVNLQWCASGRTFDEPGPQQVPLSRLPSSVGQRPVELHSCNRAVTLVYPNGNACPDMQGHWLCKSHVHGDATLGVCAASSAGQRGPCLPRCQEQTLHAGSHGTTRLPQPDKLGRHLQPGPNPQPGTRSVPQDRKGG